MDKMIKREGAYAVSHMVRWLPNSEKVMPFVLANLEQFEYFTLWSNKTQAVGDVVPSVTDEQHLANLMKHCQDAELKTVLIAK